MRNDQAGRRYRFKCSKSRLGRTSPLTLEEIASVAATAGFSGDDLATAVAVSRSESGGDPQAFNAEGSYGLWQIYIKAHPEYGQAASSGALYDPATNAAAAFKVYSDAGRTFYPWSDYKNGRYLRYLPGAQEAALNATGYFAPAPNAGSDLPIDTTGSGGQMGNDLPTSTSPAVLLLAIGAAFIGGKIVAEMFD